MRLFVCETLYHVMLATLLLDSEDDNIIICTTHEKKNMENFRRLNVSKIPEAHYIMRFRSTKKESLGLEMLYDRRFLRELKKKYSFKEFDLINFAWSVNSVDRSSAIYYKKCGKAVFYEEGAMGSIGIPQSRKKLLLKKMMGIPVAFYQDQKLISVNVQQPSLYDGRSLSLIQHLKPVVSIN